MPCKDVISSVKMLSESRSDPDVGDVNEGFDLQKNKNKFFNFFSI